MRLPARDPGPDALVALACGAVALGGLLTPLLALGRSAFVALEGRHGHAVLGGVEALLRRQRALLGGVGLAVVAVGGLAVMVGARLVCECALVVHARPCVV